MESKNQAILGGKIGIGFPVEVEDRAGADRNLHLILEVISDSIIGDQLVL